MAITAAQVKDLREKTGVGMLECKKALQENGGDVEKSILWLRERGLARASKKAGRITAEGRVQVLVNPERTKGVVVELNCETDFVNQNPDFDGFAKACAQLVIDKEVTSAEQLKETKMNDGVLVADALTALISKTGENLNLRRVGFLKAGEGQAIGGYCHGGGRVGTLALIDGVGSADSALVEEIVSDLAMHCAACAPRYLNSDRVDPKELEQEKELARKKVADEGKPPHIVEKILQGQMKRFFADVCFEDQVFVKDNKASVKEFIGSKIKGSSLKDFAFFKLGEGIEKKQEDFAAEVEKVAKST